MNKCICIEPNCIYFKKLHPEAKEPMRLTSDSVGYDLFALEDCIIPSRTVTKVRTGISICLCPLHYEFYPQIYDKSSIFSNESVFVLKGVLDPGYRGEVKCVFMNYSNKDVYFLKHQSIAQIVFTKVSCPKLIEMESCIDKTERGERGFGEVTKAN